MQTLILFDVGSNRLRLRVERACRDAGMQRLQFSAFLGEVSRDRLDHLRERLQREVAAHRERERDEDKARALLLHLFLIDEGSFAKAQTLSRRGLEVCAPGGWPDILIL